MSGLRDTLVTWADRRVEEILAAPRMWGSPEAVEMQVLQLLELRALALRPAQEIENPRRVLDTYVAFLRARFPAQPPNPLFRLIDDVDAPEFRTSLLSFRDTLARTVLEENPFEHSLLALKLSFQPGRPPSTSAFTGYYEEFRRAARAAVRSGEKGIGRAKKDVENATDFTLEDAQVTPSNGAPGQVLLRLGAGTGQQNFEAETRVRDALSTIVSMVEWAGTSATVLDLPFDDVEQRTRIALQALRILPQRGIKMVSIGGKLVARPKPVELRADHEKRFLEVVGAEATPEAFDETEEIRAIDLDRGLVVLGKKARISCYVKPDSLGGVAAVGVQARVVGQRYRPLAGRSFVLADRIDVEERTSQDD